MWTNRILIFGIFSLFLGLFTLRNEGNINFAVAIPISVLIFTVLPVLPAAIFETVVQLIRRKPITKDGIYAWYVIFYILVTIGIAVSYFKGLA